MQKGSCLCGIVSYELKSDLKDITNCHCVMCQKQHGSAFATFGNVPVDDLVYKTGKDKISTYMSSETVSREFCGNCGSNLTWYDTNSHPELIYLAVSSVDTKIIGTHVDNIYVESKVTWLGNS